MAPNTKLQYTIQSLVFENILTYNCTECKGQTFYNAVNDASHQNLSYTAVSVLANSSVLLNRVPLNSYDIPIPSIFFFSYHAPNAYKTTDNIQTLRRDIQQR